jgi:hypothetical protein
MRLLSTLANADHGSSTADRLHGAQVSQRDRLCCRCQRSLQSLDIRMRIRLPAAGTTAVTTMLIGDFPVDGSESGRGEIHHRHGRKLSGTKDFAEGRHDRPMHLCAGSFAVSIWLHDCSRPLPCSPHGGRPQRPRAQKSELCAQSKGPIRPDATAIKLSPALNALNASKLGKKEGRPATHFGLGRRGSGQNDVLARASPPPIPAGTPSARQHPAPVILPSGAKAIAHMPPPTWSTGTTSCPRAASSLRTLSGNPRSTSASRPN